MKWVNCIVEFCPKNRDMIPVYMAEEVIQYEMG